MDTGDAVRLAEQPTEARTGGGGGGAVRLAEQPTEAILIRAQTPTHKSATTKSDV